MGKANKQKELRHTRAEYREANFDWITNDLRMDQAMELQSRRVWVDVVVVTAGSPANEDEEAFNLEAAAKQRKNRKYAAEAKRQRRTCHFPAHHGGRVGQRSVTFCAEHRSGGEPYTHQGQGTRTSVHATRGTCDPAGEWRHHEEGSQARHWTAVDLIGSCRDEEMMG
jgi:hypothetical protein